MIRLAAFVVVVCAGFQWREPALAQLMLPGAAAPTPAGASPSDAKPAGKPGDPTKKKAGSGNGAPPESGGKVLTKAPGEETVAGLQFQRNGRHGLMSLQRGAKGLELGKLVLIGYQISRPAEFCRVEVSESRISLKTEQRYQGLLSYQLELAACPFSIDVLDGAVRARGEICAFKEADCNVDPSGIWGPPGASIGPEQAKSIEKIRAGADKDARAAYRAALSRFAGDRSRTKEITRDQAGFSSVREEACRDYDREDKHGFCASRVTLARAVALSAELAQPVSKPEPKKPEAPAKTGQPNTAAAPVTPPVAPTPVPASNPAPEDGLVPTPSFSLPPAALPQQRLR